MPNSLVTNGAPRFKYVVFDLSQKSEKHFGSSRCPQKANCGNFSKSFAAEVSIEAFASTCSEC